MEPLSFFATDSPLGANNVQALTDYLLWHGVLGERRQIEKKRAEFIPSEFLKLSVARTLYCVIPKKAIEDLNYQPGTIKSIIRHHLLDIDVHDDDLLIEIIKRICDQILLTDPGNTSYVKRKMRVSDLRARNRRRYKEIRSNQNSRCKNCGIHFDYTLESLDHIVPWRIIGDVPDGSNWQLLCDQCNNAKSHLISSFLHFETWNWIYPNLVACSGTVSNITRYAVFADKRRCCFCGRNPYECRLYLFNETEHGLNIFSNLNTICETCARKEQKTILNDSPSGTTSLK